MRPRPNCVSLFGLDPSGDGSREFWVEKDLIQYFYKQNWLDKYKSLHCVKEVLERPTVIFQGLRREDQDEAFCYCGLPAHRYTREGNAVPLLPRMVFVVFVRSDDVIFRWDWEEADQNLTYPVNYRTRFGPQLWPKI